MANTGAIRAGKAYVELFADSSKLVRGLRLAEKKLKAFGDSIRNIGLKVSALGAAIVTPMVAATKSFANMGEHLAKMSRRTGVSVEAISELKFAAEQSGTDIDTLEKALRKMQKTVAGAADPASSAAEKLSNLGITYDQLARLRPEAQFAVIADRISQIQNPARQAAAALELFGKSGTMLLPLMQNGAKGIAELMAEAQALGLTMKGEDAAAAEELHDAFNRIRRALQMVTFQIGAALAPALLKILNQIKPIVARISEWISNNQGLIVSLAKLGLALIAAGTAMLVAGTLISKLGVGLGILATIFKSVVAALKIIPAILTAIVSPIGLVIAAAGALGAYLIYSSNLGAQALAWLGQRFAVLKDDAISSYRGIADALAAGDIGLAAKILWLTLKMEFERGKTAILTSASKFGNALRQAYEVAVDAVTNIFVDLWYGIKAGWAEFYAWHQQTTESWANWLAKRLVEIQGIFDKSLDTSYLKQNIDEQSSQKFSQIENERQAARERIEAEHQQASSAAAAEHERQMANLDAEHQAKLSAIQEELAQARKEWQAAIGQARDERTQKESQPAALREFDFSGIEDMLASVAKVSVTGTFNAVAATGLGTGSAAITRTAKATEETAKNTKRLLEMAKEAGLEFE